jgi:hypothetical protein
MIKSTQIEVASIGEMEMRLAIGAAAGSSSFCKDGSDVDVPIGGAFSTTEGAKDDANEDPPLDDTTKTAALGEQASGERSTLRTRRL